MKRIFEEIKTILIAVGIALLIRTFIVEPYEIPSGSMIPTLLVGDHILVRKFEYGIRLPLVNKYLIWWKEPARGDIIVFRYPLDQSKNFVKRVIGVPGDTIEIKNKVIYINGEPLKDKYGMYSDSRIIPNRDNLDAFVIPEGYYFVVGDNRDRSNDSRMWSLEIGVPFDPKYSLVEKGLIKGKAHAIYWSVSEDDGSRKGPFPFSLIKRFFNYFERIDWQRIGKKIYID